LRVGDDKDWLNTNDFPRVVFAVVMGVRVMFVRHAAARLSPLVG
jgi:hypothetical protein